MRALTPAEVLFDGEVPPAVLPPCDHYAGSEKLMRKSLALQQQLGPVFDITLDCEDGAQVGREAEHAELVASLHRQRARPLRPRRRAHPRLPITRTGATTSASSCAPRKRAPAYVTLPKIRSVLDAAEMVAFIEATRRELGIARRLPVPLADRNARRARRDVFDLAALPGVEALSFGLMDFVSAHDGAIPDTAMRSPGQFDHPLVRRAKLEIAAACHAHGKVPSHNVSTEVRDMSVVANDAARARNEFGYTRMWSIHPAQIEPIVPAFAPRDDEIAIGHRNPARRAVRAMGPDAPSRTRCTTAPAIATTGRCCAARMPPVAPSRKTPRRCSRKWALTCKPDHEREVAAAIAAAVSSNALAAGNRSTASSGAAGRRGCRTRRSIRSIEQAQRRLREMSETTQTAGAQGGNEPQSGFKPKKSVALSGVTAGNTALCTVGKTGNDLHYRGYDILDVASACEFEEIAYLLVHGKLPTQAELTAYKTQAQGAARPAREREGRARMDSRFRASDGRDAHRRVRARHRAAGEGRPQRRRARAISPTG